jgi:hypothetical protein
MKMLMQFLCLIIFAIAMQCVSMKQAPAVAMDENVITAEDEGYIGEDIISTIGNGRSPESRNYSPVHKEAIAREAARLDAQRNVIEICRNLTLLTDQTVDSSAFASTSVCRELSSLTKKAKVKKSRCRPDGEAVECKVVIRIERKGIKKDCDRAIAELAK